MVAMTEKITRRQQTPQELNSGQVVNDKATCIHAYTVPTPNANVAPMKCTRNMVSTCQPITTQCHNDQSERTIAARKYPRFHVGQAPQTDKFKLLEYQSFRKFS